MSIKEFKKEEIDENGMCPGCASEYETEVEQKAETAL